MNVLECAGGELHKKPAKPHQGASTQDSVAQSEPQETTHHNCVRSGGKESLPKTPTRTTEGPPPLSESAPRSPYPRLSSALQFIKPLRVSSSKERTELNVSVAV